MNRRTQLVMIGLALALGSAIFVLPAQGASLSGMFSQFAGPSNGQATPDPCLPTFTVEGVVLSNQIVYDQPNNRTGVPLLRVLKNDSVEVLGRTDNGNWLLVRTNVGIIGWVISPQVFVNKKQFGDPTVVPAVAEIPTATPTPEGATAEPTDPFASCPGIETVITATNFRLRSRPVSNAEPVGTSVKLGERVRVMAVIPGLSWVLVRTADNVEGWVQAAYVQATSAQLAAVRRDFTYFEATLTPAP
jgi:hypothetical protein